MNIFHPELPKDPVGAPAGDHGQSQVARPRRSKRGESPAYYFLLIFAGGMTVPVLIFATFIAWYYVDSERDRALEQAHYAARELSFAVDQELSGPGMVLTTLATTPSLLRGDLAGFHERASEAAKALGVTIVLRKPGEPLQLLNTSVPWGLPLGSDDPEILASEQRAIQTRNPVVTNLISMPDQQKAVVVLMVPVTRGHDVVYFLSITIPAAKLASVLTQVELQQDWVALLVDLQGHVIARSLGDTPFIGEPPPMQWARDTASSEGIWRGAYSDGVDVVSIYARSAKTGWASVVTVPSHLLTAPIWKAAWTLLSIGMGLLVVALALAYWAGSLLARAFDSLQTAAMKLKNSLSVSTIDTPVRELNEVGRVLLSTAAEAQRREAHLRSILATVPSAMIVIDSKGTIQSISRTAEKMFGYSADEIRGSNVSMLMPEPDRTAHDSYLEHYLRTGEKRIMGTGRMVTGKRRNGAHFPLELHVGEADVDGERLFTGFMRDQTEKQRIEQELLQTQKMDAVGKLTGGVAHDFNNLLTVIKGNLEMLEPLIGEENQDLLRDSQEAADLAAQLTSSLLAFGRRMPLNPRLSDVGALVTATGDLLRRTLGETIEIQTAIRSTCSAVIDGPQLQNAILNLAINARDAMPTGGILSIGVSQVELDEDYAAAYSDIAPGRYVMILISDTGTGMTKEVRARAFEPFFTTKPLGAGTGLGLSSVYGFVKQSGGDISLYSELDKGTTIRIYLPCANDQSEVVEHVSTSILPLPSGNGELVLVAEDDDRVRRVTIARLKGLGYRVVDAANGPTALAVLRQRTDIDLLFTDMVMPGGMTGAELAAEAQAHRPGLRILFTSGYAEPDLVRQADAKSGNWLRKPYTAAELASKLQAIFNPAAPSE